MTITALDLAMRYVGVKEISGAKNHPLVSWWLSLCGFALDTPDEVAWCSAFVNGIAWELRLPRSKSAAARSWTTVGTTVALADAVPGFDVVVLSRGTNVAQGHVGFYAGRVEILDTVTGRSTITHVDVCGGNQGDSVSVERFDVSRVVGVRRLA